MTRKSRPIADRIFRFLLRAFPSDFRGNFGPEMEQAFRDQRREAVEEQGKIGLLRLWWEGLAGIVRTAPREHWAMLKQDVAYGLRMMRNNPGFTLTVVLTLALGIGANTAIFSVVRGVLLRPLPYERGNELVLIHQQAPGAGAGDVPFSVKEITDYREQNHTLAGLVEYHSMWFTLLGKKEPERVQTGVVSANFFDVMGVKPLVGRTFLPGEDNLGAPPVLVLSYSYWIHNLGGDPSVLGRTFEMNDKVHTVVGVLPPIPQYPDENDVYMPTSACPFRSRAEFIADRESRMMNAFARLKPGATLAQAREDLGAIASRLQAEYPKSYPQWAGYRATALLLKDELTQQAQHTLLILLGTTGLVLLIACTNVANLSLARLKRREREMAVRTALGASRSRLVRQILTESALLAVIGGAVGLFVAWQGLDLLVAFAAKLTPRAGEIRIDTPVLLFTLLVSLATSFLFGLIAAAPTREDLSAALKEAGGHSTEGSSGHRLRNTLVVAQVALSFTLLIGAGLMTRSLTKLQHVDAGFNADHVLTMSISLNWSKYTNAQLRRGFYTPLLERVRALPGVRSAAASMSFPLNDMGPMQGSFRIEGRPIEPGAPEPMTDFQVVSSQYFETVGTPVLRGRAFTDADGADAPAVALVNLSMARHYWSNQDPIGMRISDDDGKKWITIVGVVGDVRRYGLATPPSDELYLPLPQSPLLGSTLVVRTAGDPASMTRELTSVVHQIDAQQPVAKVRTLEQVRHESLSSPRLTTILLSLFAVLALVITAFGISGVVGLSVSQRTHELGVRMALGATPGNLLRMVLRQGLAPILIGVFLGIAGAVALSRVLSGLLYGVEPLDPFTYVVAAILSLVIATVACVWPARRVTQIQPMIALRNE